ncbi:GNAT family N-acetyltransferase [Roseomonas terrae]|jgi:CelD/BcsL family acetyltransferase involved in cellulose biosynthesis|uniref:GNAT family N-acetyltransferase n=1 Tax=Neoroseomonas terrae TaxID=424799 RepID=A0ABS5EJ46_9PROT|nr:GNAT family N-acetyltransferase [Neoroseomonas terrae]MBR0651031.1 GNAT family N-acetyltransferase [Neoroseomonas terrae]
MTLRILAGEVHCFRALGETWRALEAGAPACSFFQSWSWIGCLAAERFANPVVLQAFSGDRLVGLALCNRRDGALHLTASGDARLDAVFVEHNGPLLAADAPAGTDAAMLTTALRLAGTRRLVLDGIAPSLAAALPVVTFRRQDRPAPRVELAALRAAGVTYRQSLSGNTRHQLLRSLRGYAAQGTVTLARAGSSEEALDWFEAMVALHGADWGRRGLPGAFANPFMWRFHRALIDAAFPRGEVDLLRVTAGPDCVGFLYNFRWRGWIHAYQSGFERQGIGPHAKPGLTSHLLAIEAAEAEGAAVYDFLAGAARWKSSLGTAAPTLSWVECAAATPSRRLVAGARLVAVRWKHRLRG